jgi:HIT domain-containing protein
MDTESLASTSHWPEYNLRGKPNETAVARTCQHLLHDGRRSEAGGQLARLHRSGHFAGDAAAHLVVPKRHAASYFDLNTEEKGAIDQLLEQSRLDIVACDPTVMGFNIGINIGEVAGQTIFHCHVHLIPGG